MKKEMRSLTVMTLVLSVVLTGTACGNQESSGSTSDTESNSISTVDEWATNVTEDETAGTQAEVEAQTETETQPDTKDDTETQTSSADDTTDVTGAIMIEEADRNYTVISQSETVRLDGTAEFTIEYSLITDKVVPTIIPEEGSYSYLQADEDEVYVDVCMAYTNLSDSDISVTEAIDAALLCGWEEREFVQFYSEKDERTGLTAYGTAMSQETVYIHLVFDISDEYETNGKALQMFFCVGENNYMYMVNTPTDAGDLVTNGAVENYTEISKGEVTIGDIMKEEGLYEAYIVYANITEETYAAMPTGNPYAKADDDEKYVDICICYKNASQEESMVGFGMFSSDGNMTGGLVGSDKTSYSGALVFEDEDRDGLVFNVITASDSLEPDESVYMHLLFSVPEEVADSGESLQVYFSFNDSEEVYVFNYR